MRALRCRSCSHEQGLRGDYPQHVAAEKAEKLGWFVHWVHSPGFRNPFAKFFCSRACYMIGKGAA